MEWLDDDQFQVAPMAERDDVLRFHDPAYLDALQRAEAAQAVSAEDRERYRIGAENNPVYAEVFRRPMTSAGGVMLACRLALNGGVVHCPGGGTHHGRPARASGFCYLNDPVLGILTWLDAGLDNVVYLDIDAHHGDGVQDAFAGDARVLCISIHEDGRWPFTGRAEDRAAGSARNLPVPRGFNDTEMRWLMEQAVLPLIRARGPQAIFLQCGADALEEDPLAKLGLSNNAHWGVAAAAHGAVAAAGGDGRAGGITPTRSGRCWAGVWATLNGIPSPRADDACGGGGVARADATTVPRGGTRRSIGSPRSGTSRARARAGRGDPPPG